MPDSEFDASTYVLNESRHREIFTDLIVPVELSAGIPQERPQVLLLGGQTGAGKSVMKGTLTASGQWAEAVEFGSDTLRVYHPDYENLLKVDADRACFYTDPDARAWVSDALDHSLNQRFSVVFDSTLSRPATAEQIATRFHEAGYRIEAAFVAAPAAQSKLGVVTRYLESVEQRQAGRFSLNHDETYEGVVNVAGWIDQSAPFDAVSVYRRGGERLYTNTTDGEGRWVDPPNARQTIEDERNRPWSAAESEVFVTAVRGAAAKVDLLERNGQHLEPVWLSRIADAGQLGVPLATGDANQDLQNTVAALREEVLTRTQPAGGAVQPEPAPSRLQAAAQTAAEGHDRAELLQRYQERRAANSTAKGDDDPQTDAAKPARPNREGATRRREEEARRREEEARRREEETRRQQDTGRGPRL